MFRSGESLRFSLPRFPHPPPQAPGSPGACWEPRPGLWARLVGGRELLPSPSSPPWPDSSPRLRVWEVGKEGKEDLSSGLRPVSSPPPSPLLLRPLPASPPSPQQVATPARGPFSTHPHSIPTPPPAPDLARSSEGEGEREGRRKREEWGEGMEEREGEKRERKGERDPERRLEDGRRVEARLNKKQGGKGDRNSEKRRDKAREGDGRRL